MLRAILFDFNGVLIDDEPLHLELLERVLAQEGVALAGSEPAALVGRDDRGVVAAALERAGRPADGAGVMRLVARKASYYQEALRAAPPPLFQAAVGLAVEAREAGLMLGIVSGALRREVEQGLARAGLADAFTVRVTAEDVEHGKPAPDGYLRALRRLNSRPPLPERLVHPHEILAIEDSPAGLEAAAAAGLTTLAVTHTVPAELLAAADRVVPSLDGVSVDDLSRMFG